MTPDITAELVHEAISAAEPARSPVGVSVLVASRDPEVIAALGPRLAAELYPGRRFRGVIHHEPHPDPDTIGPFAAGQWSEVVVKED